MLTTAVYALDVKHCTSYARHRHRQYCHVHTDNISMLFIWHAKYEADLKTAKSWAVWKW